MGERDLALGQKPWNSRMLPAALGLLYVGLLLLHLPIRPYSDDLWYMEELYKWDSFFALQADYYMGWSGRIVSSALAFWLMGKAFWLWRLLNPLVAVGLVYGVARIGAAKPTARTTVAVALLLLLAGPGVLDYSVFWATGSLYYLWPVTGAVWLLLPFFDLALRGETRLRFLPARMPLAVAACLGNEQATACAVGFMAVILAVYLLRRKKILWRHTALLGAGAAAAAVLFASPGSQKRYQQESYLYFLEFKTGFYEVPTGEKVAGGIAWMYGMLFSLVLVLLLALYAASWYRVYRQSGRDKTLPGLLLFGLLCFSAALVFPQQADAMFRFGEAATGGGVGSFWLAAAPYAYWTLFLAALCYLLARQNWYYLLGLLAGLCTLVVLFWSPTIYTSGERTLFVLVVVLVAMLAAQFKNKVPALPLVLIACLAAANLIRLVGRLQLFYG